MVNGKILIKLNNGNEMFVDLQELITEKYNITPDKITGVEEVKTYTKVQKRHFRKGEFFMESFALGSLIMEKNYNGTDLKVLIVLRNRLDFNNRIRTFTQQDIAIEAKSSQPNVSRSIKKLIKDRIIFKAGHDYFFSDEYIKGAGNDTLLDLKSKRQKIKEQELTQQMLDIDNQE